MENNEMSADQSEAGAGQPRQARRALTMESAVIFVSFFFWLPIYLIYVRPVINGYVGRYISGYPAILHLIPIFGVPFLLGGLMKRFAKGG
jgi:hypothetical protein